LIQALVTSVYNNLSWKIHRRPNIRRTNNNVDSSNSQKLRDTYSCFLILICNIFKVSGSIQTNINICYNHTISYVESYGLYGGGIKSLFQTVLFIFTISFQLFESVKYFYSSYSNWRFIQHSSLLVYQVCSIKLHYLHENVFSAYLSVFHLSCGLR